MPARFQHQSRSWDETSTPATKRRLRGPVAFASYSLRIARDAIRKCSDVIFKRRPYTRPNHSSHILKARQARTIFTKRGKAEGVYDGRMTSSKTGLSRPNRECEHYPKYPDLAFTVILTPCNKCGLFTHT